MAETRKRTHAQGLPRLADGELKVAPSVLAADFGTLAAEVAKVEGVTDWLHLDVMDGHFVPNITIGPPVVESLRPHTGMFFDCHLMMTNPGDFLEAFRDAGADSCSVHVEVGDTEALCAEMRRLGLGVGLVVNPETPYEAAAPYLRLVDLLLIMTVHPGFGNQSYIPDAALKLTGAREQAEREGLGVTLQVDGGIDEVTAPVAASLGARCLVAGTAVFHRPDAAEAVRRLHVAASAAISVCR
ncbi:MAG: ribulose-phosphate 3-epimerase [Acidimicrobiales bacterium]